MLTERKSAAALLLLLALFVVGIARLFDLRFSAGDIYPAYSSLRADPVGAKALYESLDALPSLKVSRLRQPLQKLDAGTNSVLFVFGASDADLRFMDQDDFNALHNFLLAGGRAVFAFYPQLVTLSPLKDARKPPSGTNHNVHTNKTEIEAEFPVVSLESKYDFQLKSLPLTSDGSGTLSDEAHLAETNSGLPDEVSWHSAIYFNKPGASWHILYRRHKQAVLMERRVGAGSLVLASDSYFVSNEALRKERLPALLAWLAGGRPDIIFDETHLGVVEQPGLAMLIRKYGLTGVASALLLVAALFIWRNIFSFVPPYALPEDQARAGWVQGRDSVSGMASLLRRNISPAAILSTCVAEWKRSQGRAPAGTQKIVAMDQILAEEESRPPRSRTPLASYRAIQQVLSRTNLSKTP